MYIIKNGNIYSFFANEINNLQVVDFVRLSLRIVPSRDTRRSSGD